MDGKHDRAIQTSLRILDFEPDNIHALSNLARLYFLSGRPAEAVQYAQRLKDSQSDATNRWTKIAEALTFLEDDQDVLSLLELARAAGELEPPFTDEIFYHLLAAASCFRGNEKDARKFWQKALRINPNFDWALENLDDLKKPENDRSGVWAYPLENWLLSAAMRDLSAQMGKLKLASNKSDFQNTLLLYFEEKHPEVFFLAPHMVARGDAAARDFVVRMAAITAHPGLVSAAKDFIFGKRGAFQERFDASHILSEADLLPSGPVQMWSDGEMREVMLLNIMIDPEPEPSKLPQRVRVLAEGGWKAIRDQNGRHAQELLEQALALWPDDPSLLNNLAMALEMQGQKDKARQLIREVHARFPDYFFGIIGIAGLEVLQGNLDHAHELLNDLIQRKKLHTSEFTALCQAQIQAYLAESNRKFARAWLEAWEQVDPEHPRLETYRKRIGKDRKK
jgi:Flp pilus assembly protein TadD